MSAILHSSEEPLRNSKIVLADSFDPAKAHEAFKDYFKDINPQDKEARLYYYTPPHVGLEGRIGLFGDFAPGVVFAANYYHGLHLPYREQYLEESAWSKLCHLYCTTDRSVMFGHANRHMVQSKVFNLNSAATMMGRVDLCLDAEELDRSEITDQRVIEILFEVKKNATQLLRRVKREVEGGVKKEASKHSYAYPQAIKDLMGNNFASLVLYGSSAKGEGSDFDNVVAIQRLDPTLYQKIAGVEMHEGKKSVGFIFVPEYVLPDFFYINVSNVLFKDQARVLEGSAEFPNETPRYTIFKETYHAALGSAKLLSALNLVYRNPKLFVEKDKRGRDKSGLFEYFMKLNRFTYQGLAQRQGYHVLPKEEVLTALREKYDYTIAPFKEDPAYIQECFLKANAVSVRLAETMFDNSLAREKNETSAQIVAEVAPKLFEATSAGKKVFVFAGKRTLAIGDFVPVEVLQQDDSRYPWRAQLVARQGISAKDSVLALRL